MLPEPNRRGHPIYELMIGVGSMQEPIGAVLATVAESIGFTGEGMRLLIGSLGMVLLAVSFSKSKEVYSGKLAAAGWILLGLFIYLLSEYYVKIGDPVLVLMTAGALPGGFILAYLEAARLQTLSSETRESIIWFRGMVAWSMIPYHIVYSIPYLNVAFVMLTAHSAL